MEWDLCSSVPWVPFYPCTIFQYPMSKTSCQTCNNSVLVTQTMCIANSQTICADFQAFLNTLFPVKIDVFFFNFLSGKLCKQPNKFHILLIFTEKNALKWLEWCIFRV